MNGKLIGVGLGPGDPELITIKADRIIREAEVIAYPEPDNGESFARSVAAASFADDVIEIPITIPMKEDRFPAQEVYEAAAKEIETHLTTGIDVVVLCQGDPFFYGSFMYLFERVSKRFPVEIIPGVTSMTACAAVAKTPLCARMESLSVLPSPMDETRLARMLSVAGAAAFVKVGRHLAKVRRVIDRFGLTDRSIFVAYASLPQQIVLPLSEAPSEAPYFSIVLVQGEDPYANP